MHNNWAAMWAPYKPKKDQFASKWIQKFFNDKLSLMSTFSGCCA